MDLHRRARQHAAIGDPIRLAIAEELLSSDRSPGELAERLGLSTNLLAHHLGVLEAAHLVRRTTSDGDRRRRYLRADRPALRALGLTHESPAGSALFVCTHNSARSQLAAALWQRATGAPAVSAGTHPADRVHPGAIAAARRAGLPLSGQRPRHLDEVATTPDLVITVCDQAHEELDPPRQWWHWSIPDPVCGGTAEIFDITLTDIADRIGELTGGPAWS